MTEKLHKILKDIVMQLVEDEAELLLAQIRLEVSSCIKLESPAVAITPPVIARSEVTRQSEPKKPSRHARRKTAKPAMTPAEKKAKSREYFRRWYAKQKTKNPKSSKTESPHIGGKNILSPEELRARISSHVTRVDGVVAPSDID